MAVPARRTGSLRCEYPLYKTDIVTSVTFDRPVHDVRMWIGKREAVLHEGHLEAGHAVRLYARPRIHILIAWLGPAVSLEATAYDDDDGVYEDNPTCSIECRLLPHRIVFRPRGCIMPLRCGCTVRLDGGETAVG